MSGNNGTHVAPRAADRDLQLTIQHEAELLGGLLLDSSCAPQVTTAVEDFCHPSHRLVFSAWQAVRDCGEPQITTAIAQHLHAQGKLEEAGGIDFLLRLMEAVPHVGHVAYHNREVLKAAERRRLSKRVFDIQKMLADPAADLAEACDLLDGATAHIRDTGAGRLQWIKSRQLVDTSFRVEYLIAGLMVRGAPGLLAGVKKSLKTSIAIDASISLSTATPFLGKFPVPKAVRVGVISAESGGATIRETALRVAEAKEVDLREIDGLHWCFDIPNLTEPAELRELEQFIVRNHLEVLVIDPTYLAMHPGDSASNLFTMGKLLAPLTAIGNRTGATILLCHHCRRTGVDAEKPPELGDVAWSGFAEWARQWILLGRRVAYEPGTGLHKLWLNVGGSAGHSGLWAVDVSEGRQDAVGGRFWSVLVASPEDARDAAAFDREQHADDQARKKLERAKAKILAALADGQAKTRAEIKAAAGLKTQQMADGLDALMSSQEIVGCEIEKGNSRKYPAFQLNSDQPSQVDSDDH